MIGSPPSVAVVRAYAVEVLVFFVLLLPRHSRLLLLALDSLTLFLPQKQDPELQFRTLLVEFLLSLDSSLTVSMPDFPAMAERLGKRGSYASF